MFFHRVSTDAARACSDEQLAFRLTPGRRLLPVHVIEAAITFPAVEARSSVSRVMKACNRATLHNLVHILLRLFSYILPFLLSWEATTQYRLRRP